MTAPRSPQIVLCAPPPVNPLTGGYLFNARVAELAAGVQVQLADATRLRAELRAAAPGTRIFALDSLYLAELTPSDWAGHTVVQVVHSLPPRGVATARVATALQSAAGCITTSAFMAREVAARAAHARVQTCRPGVVAQPQRRELNAAALRILTVANGEPRKGHLALLDVLGVVRDLPWCWQVIGDFAVDPPHAAAFRHALAESGLTARVQLLGVQTPEQVQTAMAQAALLALLSENEPYGMVYAESLAAGTPVLAWRQGGVVETVTHDVTGRLVAPGDRAHAARELRALLESPDLRDRLRAGCVEAAQTLPDWPTCARQFAAQCRAFAEVRA